MFSDVLFEIDRLDMVNAKHIKSGRRIGEVSTEFILSRVKDEIAELEAAPDDIDEMADIFAILIHYCVRKKWSRTQVDEAVLKKLKMRLVEEKDRHCRGDDGGLTDEGKKDGTDF